MSAYTKKEKLKIEVLSTREEREHFHQDIELLFVLEGALEVRIGEQAVHMKEEDLLVVNANKKHSLKGTEDILFARLFITYQLVSDIFESMNIIFWCDSTRSDNQRYDELRTAMKQLLNHYLSAQGGVANFGHIALCYRVMDLLSVHFLVKSGDREGLDDFDKFEERITQINNYIRANYAQPISMKELSEKLYLSNGYLSRFFKKNYGMSFAEYLTNIRLFHAVDDLLYTSIPITKIAFENGFGSMAMFNKAFKSVYGETPSAFRKQAREDKKKQEQLKMDIIAEGRLEAFLRNDGLKREQELLNKKEIAEYDVKNYEPLHTYWNDMINGGAAEDLLNSGVREHILLLKEALQFQYVRFWRIFSEEMLLDVSSKEENHNFSRLDSILDFLLQNGLKPHIELGLKPKRVMSSVQNVIVQDAGQVIVPSLESWKAVLHSLMKHLLHRYGRSEVKTWRMELWFVEELMNQGGNLPQYFEVFDATYGIVHQYSRELKVGGCGFRMDMWEQQGMEMMSLWRKRTVQPDFLSFLYYGYERGGIAQDMYSKRITDNEGVLHWILEANSALKEIGYEGTPIYCTEWNLTISDRNYINDTCFKGAYIVKNYIDAYGKIDSMAYFLGSDRISEHYDSGDMLFGGMGILSRDGIMKPAAFAFDFLNRQFPYFIGKGENYMITTDAMEVYGIVCHNQKKLNYNYYLSREDQIDRENIWKYFEDRTIFEQEILLANVEPGTYQMKTYRINEKNGSVLELWSDMNFEKEITRNDIRYFRKICEPKLSIQKLEAQNQNLKIKIRMEPNEIAFIRIRHMI
jgi:beta-xylosidase/AraC-like DNA-binding protein